MWKEGKTGEWKWEAKVYDQSSCFGIDGGRVSKLTIRAKQGNRWKPIYHYDRGLEMSCSSKILNAVMKDVLK